MVICECAHFHPRELIPELKQIQARHYVLTHLHDSLLDNPEETEELFAPLLKVGQVTFASDTTVLEV